MTLPVNFVEETRKLKDLGFKYELAEYPFTPEGGSLMTDITLSRTGFGRLSDKFTRDEGWGLYPGGTHLVASLHTLVASAFQVAPPAWRKRHVCADWDTHMSPAPTNLALAKLQYLGVDFDVFYELAEILHSPLARYQGISPKDTSQFPLFNAIREGFRST